MRHVLRSEIHKARFSRTAAALLPVWLMDAVAVAVAPAHTGPFALSGDFAQRTLACTGATVAGIAGIVLGVLGMAGEYRHRTLTATLLVTPRRYRVLAAKAAVHFGLGALLGLAAGLSSITAVHIGLAVRGVPAVLPAGDLAVILLGAVLYTGLAAVFGLAAGAATADPVTGLAAVLSLFFVVETLLAGVAPGVARWLPGQAGSALYFPAGPEATSRFSAAHALSQPAGGAIFACYTAALLVAAFLLTGRRDIT